MSCHDCRGILECSEDEEEAPFRCCSVPEQLVAPMYIYYSEPWVWCWISVVNRMNPFATCRYGQSSQLTIIYLVNKCWHFDVYRLIFPCGHCPPEGAGCSHAGSVMAHCLSARQTHLGPTTMTGCNLKCHKHSIPLCFYRLLLPRRPKASLVPSMPRTSLSLIRNSAPRSLPTPGRSTPPPSLVLSLLRLFFPVVSLSRMMPFSLASLLRFTSRACAAAAIPLRICIGILSCLWIDSFAPRACTRRSVVFLRVRPSAKDFGSTACWMLTLERDLVDAACGARRCDSASRRRSSRSCLRREGASSGRAEAGVVEDDDSDCEADGLGMVWSGGRED